MTLDEVHRKWPGIWFVGHTSIEARVPVSGFDGYIIVARASDCAVLDARLCLVRAALTAPGKDGETDG